MKMHHIGEAAAEPSQLHRSGTCKDEGANVCKRGAKHATRRVDHGVGYSCSVLGHSRTAAGFTVMLSQSCTIVCDVSEQLELELQG
jgi:hypothetical protein